MEFVVYRRTNIVNGKQYVGKTKDFNRRIGAENRKANLRQGKNIPLERAINKYGADMFYDEILETFDNERDALEAEKMYIVRYNTRTPNGYNVTPGGDGVGSGKDNPLYGTIPWNKGTGKIDELGGLKFLKIEKDKGKSQRQIGRELGYSGNSAISNYLKRRGYTWSEL